MLDQLLLSTARASAPATATTATTATTCVMIVMVMVVIMVRISLLFRLSFCNKHNFLKSDWLSQFLLNPTVLTLEALRGGGRGIRKIKVTPSIFLALNFCCLTDYQKLW